MITKIEARGYRCLRDVSVNLTPFQVLIGPNGSGKSTLLDVVAFLGDVTSKGLKHAIGDRTDNFFDLVWGRKETSFSLVIEARMLVGDGAEFSPDVLRYEMDVEIESDWSDLRISRETLDSFGPQGQSRRLIERDRGKIWYPEGNAQSYRMFHIDPNYSGLSTPVSDYASPAIQWLKELLRDNLTTVALDNGRLRASTPPGDKGLNLAPLVARLSGHPDRHQRWIRHVRTAISDIETIRVVTRPEDSHRYLMITYLGGVEVPQWAVSDGTLRLLALTVLAYLPDVSGLYLIEEPENGLHPTAIETVIQSLTSFYGAQVLVTTHSPLVLGLLKPEQLLCFEKTDGVTVITPGDQHPILKEWKAGVDLSDLFAAGVLG